MFFSFLCASASSCCGCLLGKGTQRQGTKEKAGKQGCYDTGKRQNTKKGIKIISLSPDVFVTNLIHEDGICNLMIFMTK